VNSTPSASSTDLWADWLLHRRHADDSEYAKRVNAVVLTYIDRVLDHGPLAPNMHILDVGSGEGTLGFRAIERAGASLKVTMTDISTVMLSHARAQAQEKRLQDQCTFVQTSADCLEGIPDASIDLVTTRSVLAYVADKRAALNAMHRVLKPGGRLSIAEPIFQDDAFDASVLKNRIDAQPSEYPDIGLTLLHRWKAAQFPDTPEKIAQNPIANFSERDLLRFAVGQGFTEIHMELHVDVFPSIIQTWDVFIGASPHPWAPSLKQIMAEQFSESERQHFEQMVRPSIEAGHPVSIDRMAYLSATKPI